ncbi:MAG: cell division protein ZapB [Deltaproteobacteria bacterium]|nr:MAG: cell division protein ZapB [Deltaproteobacteria bacterium]
MDEIDAPDAAMAAEHENVSQETPFDRLEARIDALLERYEQLQSEHNVCGQKLAEREAHIRQLEAQLEDLEQQRLEVRGRLDALIDKLSRF